MINVSKVVALFIVVHFFEDIGNFIDFCFDALRSKDCFLLEFDYKCTVRKKKENFYIILQKKKRKNTFEILKDYIKKKMELEKSI